MDTSFTTAIDLYCERTDPGFWAEPINALTNLSFIVAAGAIMLLISRRDLQFTAPASLLTASMACIGAGSFLFHTLANRWTMLADVLPIFIYQLAFLALYARNIGGLAPSRVATLVLVYCLLSFGFARLPSEWLNGSLAYGGALVFITAIGIYHRTADKHEPWILLLAVSVLLLSLGFRSLDMALCEATTLGTHFLWHLLNGLVLYLVTRAYVLNQPQAS
jgi:hypothetical protein